MPTSRQQPYDQDWVWGWLAISFLVHVLLVAGLRHHGARPRLEPERTTPNPVTSVELKYRSTPRSRLRPPRQTRRLRLPGFAGGSFSPPTSAAAARESSVRAVLDLESERETWGAGGGGAAFAHIASAHAFARLYEEIEGLLYYPSALARHNIDGTVNARLVFNAESRCDWSRTRLAAHEPKLRVYVLAVLKKLCAFDTLTSLHFQSGQAVDLSFRFAIVSTLAQAPPSPLENGAITGNVLLFERVQVSNPLEYQLGPLRGLWVAPVIYVDFPWLVEHWDTWINGRDPLREFKEP